MNDLDNYCQWREITTAVIQHRTVPAIEPSAAPSATPINPDAARPTVRMLCPILGAAADVSKHATQKATNDAQTNQHDDLQSGLNSVERLPPGVAGHSAIG